VKFIGHMVGSGTRSPVTDKVLAIKAIPEPHTKRLLRGYIGMLNFYRMYIPYYSDTALPLTEMTKHSGPNKISFNEVQRRAFETLKEKLCNCTNLHAINYLQSWLVVTGESHARCWELWTQVTNDETMHCPGASGCNFTGAQGTCSTTEWRNSSVVHGLNSVSSQLTCEKEAVVPPQSARLKRWTVSLPKPNCNIQQSHVNMSDAGSFHLKANQSFELNYVHSHTLIHIHLHICYMYARLFYYLIFCVMS